MDDLKRFYTRLLRIERPWIVLEVRFQDQERVDVYLDHERGIPEALLPRFEELRRVDLQVSRAWALKENLRKLWTYRRQGWARRFFRRWYFWAPTAVCRR